MQIDIIQLLYFTLCKIYPSLHNYSLYCSVFDFLSLGLSNPSLSEAHMVFFSVSIHSYICLILSISLILSLSLYPFTYHSFLLSLSLSLSLSLPLIMHTNFLFMAPFLGLTHILSPSFMFSLSLFIHLLT